MEDNGNGNGRSTQNNNRSSSNMLNKLNNVFRGGGDHRGSVSGTGLNGKSVFGSNLSIFSKVSRNVRPRRASRIRRSNSKQSFLSAEPNVERGAIMSKVPNFILVRHSRTHVESFNDNLIAKGFIAIITSLSATHIARTLKIRRKCTKKCNVIMLQKLQHFNFSVIKNLT